MNKPAPRTPGETEIAARVLASVPAQSWQLEASGLALPVTGLAPVRPTRREFLVGAGSLLVLGVSGCGRDETGGSFGETQTVDSVYGEVELPAQPQRLIPGYTTEMDYALLLGIPMAAGTGAQGGRGGPDEPFAAYQREAYPEELEGLGRVQTYPEANLEQIAAAQPDCILDHVAAGDENRYELLSQIAPTFVFRAYEEAEGYERRPDWRGSLQEIARAFGGTEKADRFIADYEARAKDLRGRLAERWSGAAVAAIHLGPESIRVWGRREVQALQILFEDLGLTPASVVGPDTQELSLEALPEVDADVLFQALAPMEDSLERNREDSAPYVNSPLWQEIPAVEKGQVYEYDVEIQNTSPLTAAAFLDFVEKSLLA